MPSKSVFLTFEPVTVVPIQTKLILPDLMTRQEIDWLNNYHQLCRDRWGRPEHHVSTYIFYIIISL